MSIGFTHTQAILGIRGEVDLATAFELAAVLDAVIDRAHNEVVLDLGECKFMGAAGLKVIELATERLRSSTGSMLTLRAVPVFIDTLLAMTGLAGLVDIEPLPTDDHKLGPESLEGEQSVRRGRQAPQGASKRSYHRPVDSIQTEKDVVAGALRLVVELALAAVDGADGVSVSLRRHGHLSTVAGSNQTILDMDAQQYRTGEGPCVDASVKGHWFYSESLANEVRWPKFTPKAHGLGINAILSSPLLADDRPIGALNIYSLTPGAFGHKQQKLASLFASEASIMLKNTEVAVSEDPI